MEGKMKKVLLVGLMVLLSMGMLFALSDEDGTMPAKGIPESESVNFVLNLSGGEESTSSWEVGFSNAAVNKDSGITEEKRIDANENLNLVIDDTTHTASYGSTEGNSNFHAYWNITSGTPAVVKLYMEKALTGNVEVNGVKQTIPWSVTANGNTQNEGRSEDFEYGAGTAITIVTTNPAKNGVVDIGSVPVEIKTGDFSDEKPDTFSAALYISIEANS